MLIKGLVHVEFSLGHVPGRSVGWHHVERENLHRESVKMLDREQLLRIRGDIGILILERNLILS